MRSGELIEMLVERRSTNCESATPGAGKIRCEVKFCCSWLVALKPGDHTRLRRSSMGLGVNDTVGNVVDTAGRSSDWVRLPPSASVPHGERCWELSRLSIVGTAGTRGNAHA